MSISLSESTVSKLLVHSFDKWNEEKKKLFLRHVLTACESRTEQFLKYMEAPELYVSPDSKLSIGDKVYVKEDAIWSTPKKWLQDNGYVTEGMFQATVEDFEFIAHEKIVIRYPTAEGTDTHSIFFSYLTEPDLL